MNRLAGCAGLAQQLVDGVWADVHDAANRAHGCAFDEHLQDFGAFRDGKAIYWMKWLEGYFRIVTGLVGRVILG